MRKIITTFFACLGLAGLSENIVEWQAWFQTGILAHWTAFKAAITGLLPFPIPGFLLDYLAIGALHVQSTFMQVKDWSGAFDDDERVLSRHWAYRLFGRIIGLLIFAFIILAQMLLWPWRMFLLLIYAFDPKASVFIRSESRQILGNFGYLLLAFVPFLFVCSNLLKVLQPG